MEASGGHTLLIINQDKCLVLSLLNAIRLRDKITDLQSLLLLDSFDIVAITET